MQKEQSSMRFSRPENVNTSNRDQSIIQKQNEQLLLLKEKFVELREKLHNDKRAAQVEIINLQKKIAAVQRRSAQLQEQIDDLSNSYENSAREEIAGMVIEEIWEVLSQFRDTVRERNFINEVNNISTLDKIPPTPSVDIPESPQTPIVLQSDVVVGDKTPKKSRKLSVVDTPSDSIAARRTRRGREVYYKEPTLKEALSPNSPYVFSLGEERSTPSLPSGYTRGTPMKRKYKY